MAVPLLGRSGVGVVEVFGLISGGSRVQGYTRLLDDIRRDGRLKAVVLDIDSPGGTASASELLYHSLLRLAQEKPVVAYIRGTGASGAYYISCAANKIVALPSALVGSIGVIYLRPVLQELFQKLGISFSVYTGGRLKDMGGFWRGPTSEEDGKFRGLIEEIYNNFVQAVKTGRNLEEDQVRELATGELFTGTGAQERGLVDQIGDFEDALEEAAEMGGAPPRPVWVRPKRALVERVMGRIGGPGVAHGMLPELERLLTGGVYYLAPGCMPSGSLEDEG